MTTRLLTQSDYKKAIEEITGRAVVTVQQNQVTIAAPVYHLRSLRKLKARVSYDVKLNVVALPFLEHFTLWDLVWITKF